MEYESGGALFPQFRETWGAAFAAAAELRKRLEDSAPRPRVAIDTADPQAFCALFLALCRGGFDLFLFNPRWGTSERAAALAIADPRWIVGDLRGGAFSARALPGLREDEAPPQPGMRLMIATGGTTGRARFAIHRWSTIAASAYGFQQFFGCARVASHCALPLYHVSGFMQLARALLSLGGVVFGNVDTFARSHAALAAADRDCRFVSLVATQLERLVRDEESIRSLREYRAVFVGGGPTRQELLDTCRELELPVAPTYGMTETAAQVATLKPEEFLRGETGQGRALPHARIDIVSDDVALAPLAAGQIGRIRIWATSLFQGYYGEGAPTAGPIVTSDLGLLDDSGRLSALGRADRVIISGGEKIDPAEVERAAERSGLAREVFAFGVDDPEWGQRLAIAYAPRDASVSEEALRGALRRELAPRMIPKTWLRMESIPRNEAGKPLTSQLIEAAARG